MNSPQPIIGPGDGGGCSGPYTVWIIDASLPSNFNGYTWTRTLRFNTCGGGRFKIDVLLGHDIGCASYSANETHTRNINGYPGGTRPDVRAYVRC